MPGFSTIRKAIVSMSRSMSCSLPFCLFVPELGFWVPFTAVAGRFRGRAYATTIIRASIASQSVVRIGRYRNRIAHLMSQNAATVALINRLKFKHLALLVALDDTRNVHQAADAINVAQPSASRMLGDIEEALGFLLFERNARGMQPTPLGVVTLAYARR